MTDASSNRPAFRERSKSRKLGDADTILSFCESEGISESMYYALKREGKGPREMYLGKTVRISPEAKADWRREREGAKSGTCGSYRRKLADTLAYPPRAMRLEAAAAYLSISTSSFLRMVETGELPSAVKKRGMVLWDRLDLDAAFGDWKDEQGRENSVHQILARRRAERSAAK